MGRRRRTVLREIGCRALTAPTSSTRKRAVTGHTPGRPIPDPECTRIIPTQGSIRVRPRGTLGRCRGLSPRSRSPSTHLRRTAEVRLPRLETRPRNSTARPQSLYGRQEPVDGKAGGRQYMCPGRTAHRALCGCTAQSSSVQWMAPRGASGQIDNPVSDKPLLPSS